MLLNQGNCITFCAGGRWVLPLQFFFISLFFQFWSRWYCLGFSGRDDLLIFGSRMACSHLTYSNRYFGTKANSRCQFFLLLFWERMLEVYNLFLQGVVVWYNPYFAIWYACDCNFTFQDMRVLSTVIDMTNYHCLLFIVWPASQTRYPCCISFD